jgi:upstream activation factor subunit UAF30
VIWVSLSLFVATHHPTVTGFSPDLTLKVSWIQLCVLVSHAQPDVGQPVTLFHSLVISYSVPSSPPDMVFDFGSLEPRIYQILSAPGTDLTTISAKRVRRHLLELEPTLIPEFLRENKVAVDEVIASVFERVSGQVSVEADEAGQKIGRKSRRDREEDDEAFQEDYTGDDGGGGERSPLPKKSKKGSKQEQADAELARKLSSEINGRSTRTSGKGRGSVAKRGPRGKKSAATVDSDDDIQEEGGRKAKKRSANGSGAKGGFAKEFTLR